MASISVISRAAPSLATHSEENVIERNWLCIWRKCLLLVCPASGGDHEDVRRGRLRSSGCRNRPRRRHHQRPRAGVRHRDHGWPVLRRLGSAGVPLPEGSVLTITRNAATYAGTDASISNVEPNLSKVAVGQGKSARQIAGSSPSRPSPPATPSFRDDALRGLQRPGPGSAARAGNPIPDSRWEPQLAARWLVRVAPQRVARRVGVPGAKTTSRRGRDSNPR
jgi:hypothetical protein